MHGRSRLDARSASMLPGGGTIVATFIMLSTLTDDGAQTIKEDPDRILAVNQELDRMGVRVVSQWAVLGTYDFVNVVEAPDTLTVARVSAVMAARGSVRIMTLPAIPIDDFIAGLRPKDGAS
jgi:uncharacterized protein with GYD domain